MSIISLTLAQQQDVDKKDIFVKKKDCPFTTRPKKFDSMALGEAESPQTHS
jgi:hypothetical protein